MSSSEDSSSTEVAKGKLPFKRWHELENMDVLLDFLQLSESALRTVPMSVAKAYLNKIGHDANGEVTDPGIKAARFRDQIYGFVLAGGASWFNDWCKDSSRRKPKTKNGAMGYAHCGAVPSRPEGCKSLEYDDAGNMTYALVFHAIDYMQNQMLDLANAQGVNAERTLWCCSIERQFTNYNDETAGDVLESALAEVAGHRSSLYDVW